MNLIVISPEHDRVDELEIVGELFAAGLERYHVRKPHATLAQLEAWLRLLPASSRSRLMLHQHHELVDRLGLGGRHWRDAKSSGDPMHHRPRQPEVPALPRVISRSCHDLATLVSAFGRYDAALFAPVFPSISKPGHAPHAEVSLDELSGCLARRTEAQRRTTVFALGGITAENASHALALGFDGVAVLGAIWQARDPVRAFTDVQASLLSHAA